MKWNWLSKLLRQSPQQTTRSARRLARPARRRFSPLGVEALETREVPATLSFASSVLTYTAGAGVANNLTVTYDGNTSTYTVTDAGETITLGAGVGTWSGDGTNTVSGTAP